MSAIILTRHTPTRPKPTRMSTKQLTPQLRTTERTPLLPNSKDRTAPLKDTLSTTRFVTICIGIFSANFVFAFQTTSVPTLMTGISSGWGHAELGSYLGSVFTLANTAGESTLQHTLDLSTNLTSMRTRADDSDPSVWSFDGELRAESSNVDSWTILWSRHNTMRMLREYVSIDSSKGCSWCKSSFRPSPSYIVTIVVYEKS